ncbi:hypothetical protein JCM16303_002529 [Sporobolomyces ruberrimus]
MDPPPIASTSASPPRVGASSSTLLARDPSRYLLQPTNVTPSPLSGTADLITLFNLDPLYNTFLRPYLPPSSTTTSGPVTADSPLPNTVNPPPPVKSLKGKERATSISSPAPQPYAVASPAPGHTGGGGGGFKITLGGIKLNSSINGGGGSSTNVPTLGGSSTSGKVKKVKMERHYTHMVQDVIGRNSIKKDQYLSHLVMNPDPAPCPPLQVPDAQLLRDGLTLKPGGLAGFDMSVWESPLPGEGEGGMKKRKKRRTIPDGDGGGDRKKQKQ